MPDYLVQYGRSAFVGTFAFDGEAQRGRTVVVQSPRGMELGTVLGPAKYAGGVDASSGGHWIRFATAEDEAEFHACQNLARTLLTAAEEAPPRDVP